VKLSKLTPKIIIFWGGPPCSLADKSSCCESFKSYEIKFNKLIRSLKNI